MNCNITSMESSQGNGPRNGGRATLNKILLVFRHKQEAVPVQAQSPFLSIHCLCLLPKPHSVTHCFYLPNHNYPKHMFCSFGFGIHNVLVNTSLILLLQFIFKHIVRDFKISRKFTSDGVQGKLGFSEGKFTITVESLELLF